VEIVERAASAPDDWQGAQLTADPFEALIACAPLASGV
jgi:hypothetical protein